MIKIAFTGKSGAGKDFLADFLIQKYNFHRLSFSDQLKKIARTVFPWLQFDYPPKVKIQPLNKNTGYEIITKSPREIWMFFNSLKEIERNIFVRMLAQEFGEAKNVYDKIIITDIRFWNEFYWCRNNDFFIIGIKPSKQIYKKYEIEKEIDKFFNLCDVIFYNDFNNTTGTLERLSVLIEEKFHLSGGLNDKI